MKRKTSVLLGALLWGAVLGVMVAGVLVNRNSDNDVLHATHAVRPPSPPSPVGTAADVGVAPPGRSANESKETVNKE